jgi:hypothetical protein
LKEEYTKHCFANLGFVVAGILRCGEHERAQALLNQTLQMLGYGQAAWDLSQFESSANQNQLEEVKSFYVGMIGWDVLLWHQEDEGVKASRVINYSKLLNPKGWEMFELITL